MIELGLSRVFRLLARTPLSWRAIHVAGTNGKGSICAYITGMLSAFNASDSRRDSDLPALKHGRFNSPHLIDRWDCISIDGETISESIFHQVETRVHERNNRENIQATEFELLTATAFEIFTQENVDIGVIEVGMGGRLDATNVIGQFSDYDNPSESCTSMENFRPKPLATGICAIALDHQGFLGNTLEQISTEKAGIMKSGVPVVLAPNRDVVIQNLIRISDQVGVSEVLRVEDTEAYRKMWRHSFEPTDLDNDQIRRQNSAMAFSLTWLALLQLGHFKGHSQASLACLAEAFYNVPSNTIWPGRVQDVSIECITGHKPLILVDGAHNAESAQALANTVRKRTAGNRPVIWLLGASKGKDIRSMLEHFLSVQSPETPSVVIATRFGSVDGMPWVKAMSSSEVLDEARKVVDEVDSTRSTILCDQDTSCLQRALAEACRYATPVNGLIVLAGSLYLVGDLLRLVRDKGGKIA